MSTASKRIRSPHQPTGCWIRPEKRAAIYHRDNWACVYCGLRVVDAAEIPIVLTLDHLVAKVQGGTNHETNLVSACRSCNSSRQDRDWQEFAPGGAQRRIRRLIAIPLNIAVGRAFVESMKEAA